MNKDYRKLCTSDNNNCTVVAISQALNVPMEEAYEALENAGRKHGSGAYMNQVKVAVQSLGGKVLTQGYKILDLEIKLRKTITVRTVGEWLWEGRYIMATQTHAFALVHGMIHDWCHDSKSQIHTVYKIVGGVR